MTCIYFIQSGGPEGPVKIGYAADVEQRRSNLQMGNPERLTIILEAVLDEVEECERILHERFKAHHIHGEWFRWSPELERDRRILDERFSPAARLVRVLELETS